MGIMIRNKPKAPPHKEVFGKERYLLYGGPSEPGDECEIDEED